VLSFGDWPRRRPLSARSRREHWLAWSVMRRGTSYPPIKTSKPYGGKHRS